MTETAVTTPDLNHPNVVRHKEIRRGKPTIKGTGIKVSQIVTEFVEMRWTAAEIVEAHPHLTFAQVYAALAYYHDHVEEIDRELRESEGFIREMEMRHKHSVLEEERRAAANLHG
ncbi:MAG: DUF433 domain-containing protein [Candidatus Poribacteria bacterium]|nr:DUF433 domain-containing protein [Candidatus Poribacteria bacterium]